MVASLPRYAARYAARRTSGAQPRWPRARKALVALTVLTVTAVTGCSAGQGDGWSAIGPLSDQVGAVVTLTAVGDLLVAGRSTGAGEPAVEVLADGTWTSRPVQAVTPYGRVAQWLSIVAASDGSLVAVGGARGGAHANVRWTVWRGSISAGLTEQEQTFSTFGGWGAGDQVGPVLTAAGPLLVGSWEGAQAGLDLATWVPDGEAWVRQPSAGTALESTPTQLMGARSVAAWGSGALITGSVVRLGDGAVRKVPAIWRSTTGNAGWTRVDLPDSGQAGEAVSAACTEAECTVAGWVDGRLAVWRVGADGGARRVDGIPSVAVRDSDVIPAPVFVEGRAVLLVTDHDSSRNATIVVEGRTGWSRGPGPWGTVMAFTAIGSTLYAVCQHGDTPLQVWAHRL